MSIARYSRVGIAMVAGRDGEFVRYDDVKAGKGAPEAEAETRRCDWCRELCWGDCGCDAEVEIKRLKDKAQQIIDYIDGFYVSGNSVPIDKPWISAGSWEIAKELLALGLPLEHDLIEREGVYRKKLLAYGDETRAKSPLQERLALIDKAIELLAARTPANDNAPVK